MDLDKILDYLKQHWMYIILFICVLPVIVYILVIIPFPYSGGIGRDAWVGFFGSYFGAILGGVFSVAGVFLTLDYYKNKDSEEKEKDDNKKLEERKFTKNSRILKVKPYLRIINKTVENITEYQNINITVDNENYVKNANINNNSLKTKNITFILKNDGIGIALNIICRAENKKITKNDNYGVSLSVREKCIVHLDVLSNVSAEDDINFIFNFYDIFENEYEQKIKIKIKNADNFGYSFSIKNIEAPSLINEKE
ncbi:hypothetical protein [Clostridium pasteurianum]|uniref:Uncharacterized protein n=1 Tax=Clostridium pasteurianum BC1 TaxID=86416 RepID=R4K6H7_CLOPA|nr:hypothetical protein [Clostridium pasteurianum]AGK98153.1 hypothetical protein Clopa_3357 [Clostridium pasteurianum BC1]